MLMDGKIKACDTAKIVNISDDRKDNISYVHYGKPTAQMYKRNPTEFLCRLITITLLLFTITFQKAQFSKKSG